VSLIGRLMNRSHRIERAPPRAVPESRLVEVRFENRFKHQYRCGLDNPVADRRYAERTLSHAPGLGNHHSFDRLWFVACCSNLRS